MTRTIATLTRASYPGLTHFVGRCSEPECKESPHARWATTPDPALAYLAAWFMDHIADTGHTVVIEADIA